MAMSCYPGPVYFFAKFDEELFLSLLHRVVQIFFRHGVHQLAAVLVDRQSLKEVFPCIVHDGMDRPACKLAFNDRPSHGVRLLSNAWPVRCKFPGNARVRQN